METILQAAKLEIIRVLEGDLNAESFSNVLRVARMAEDIANQEGRLGQLVRVKTRALEDSEFRTPTLHAALLADLTNGNDVVAKKYRRLQETHVEVEQSRLIADAARVKLQAEREAIHQERLAIRKMHDALMLEADKTENGFPELPALPPLPPHPLEDEEEPEEMEEDDDQEKE